MWFSPLKGAHLTLGQLDKTLPVNMAEGGSTSIERGSFVYIKATGDSTTPRFALYTDEQAAVANAVPYIALMGVHDFQAGMAGNIGQAETVDSDTGITKYTEDQAQFIDAANVEGAQDFRGPRITAISVLQAAEYQTTAFDTTKSYYVGQPLTISAGKLTPFTSGKNIVGYVTAKAKPRWINDLGADKPGARISGGTAQVLEFSTAWIPVAATNDSVQALSKNTAAAAAAPAKPAAPEAPAAPAKPEAPAAPAAPAKPATPAQGK